MKVVTTVVTKVENWVAKKVAMRVETTAEK